MMSAPGGQALCSPTHTRERRRQTHRDGKWEGTAVSHREAQRGQRGEGELDGGLGPQARSPPRGSTPQQPRLKRQLWLIHTLKGSPVPGPCQQKERPPRERLGVGVSLGARRTVPLRDPQA